MKKVFLALIVLFYCAVTLAQGKMTQEQARMICAQEMASFVKLVSAVYQKGNSYEQFQFALCGNLQPVPEGINQLKAAYGFLVQDVQNDVILKTYSGKEIAASLNYLLNAHKNGIELNGAELFGGKTGGSNNSFAKNNNGGCHWYQVLCLLQAAAAWVVMNWPGVQEIVNLLNGPYAGK